MHVKIKKWVELNSGITVKKKACLKKRVNFLKQH